MADWTIRRAVPGDAAALTTCINAAYAQYTGRISDLPPVSENCAAEIAANLVWVVACPRAERGPEIIGGLVLVDGKHALHLANIAVDPDHRGDGIARALLDLAERQARDRGHTGLQLTTHAEMPENLSLYIHLGWRETGRQGNKVFMTKAV